MNNIFHLFDLDGTAIDSFHRVQPCLDINGDLNLEQYKATACTHHQIMADRLLPLATYMRTLIKEGEKVGVCTARNLTKSDYVFLRQHGLKTAFIASRDRIHRYFPADMVKGICHSGDANYKAAWLRLLMNIQPCQTIHLYDDHDGVLAKAKELGVVTFDAKRINKMLNESFKLGMEEALNQMLEDDQDLLSLLEDDHEALTFGQ